MCCTQNTSRTYTICYVSSASGGKATRPPPGALLLDPTGRDFCPPYLLHNWTPLDPKTQHHPSPPKKKNLYCFSNSSWFVNRVRRDHSYWQVVRTSAMPTWYWKSRWYSLQLDGRSLVDWNMWSVIHHRCMCLGTWNWHVGQQAVVSISYCRAWRIIIWCVGLWSALMARSSDGSLSLGYTDLTHLSDDLLQPLGVI